MNDLESHIIGSSCSRLENNWLHVLQNVGVECEVQKKLPLHMKVEESGILNVRTLVDEHVEPMD